MIVVCFSDEGHFVGLPSLTALYLSHLLRFFLSRTRFHCTRRVGVILFLLPLTSLASAVLSLLLPFTLHTFTAFSRRRLLLVSVLLLLVP